MTNGAFIYLFGFAGSGKLTIANEIAARWDCIVVDNHYVNNVIFGLLDIDPESSGELPEAVWEHIVRVRHTTMDAIRRLARPGRNFVFTNELLEGVKRHKVFFLEVERVAQDRGAFLLPVRLSVDAEELKRRIVSPERGEKLKITNPAAAVARTESEEVFRPEGYDHLELDVTHLAPEESAERILAELQRRLEALK
jgi:predicted kinase